MKRIKKITTFLLMTILLVSGCRKDGAAGKPAGVLAGGKDSATVNANPDATELLTHVYTPTTYSMPEGFELNERVTPYYEAETDTLVCVGQRYSEDGAEYRLVTTRGDAGVADEKNIPVQIDAEYVYMEYGFITADALWFIARQYDDEKQETSYRIAHTPLEAPSGESDPAEEFDPFEPSPGLITDFSPDLNTLIGSKEQFDQVKGFAMDADGDLYVFENWGIRAVVVFRPDFSLRCKVPASGRRNGTERHLHAPGRVGLVLRADRGTAERGTGQQREPDPR